MSELIDNVVPMAGISEEALLAWLDQEGITVSEVEMPNDMWGGYHDETKQVFLQKGMPYLWRVATLLHEMAHVQNRHQGHQPQLVEDRINESVAMVLIDPVDYAFYESQFGWSTGGIAHELGLPRWVVEAYRRTLRRTAA